VIWFTFCTSGNRADPFAVNAVQFAIAVCQLVAIETLVQSFASVLQRSELVVTVVDFWRWRARFAFKIKTNLKIE
jgi:hypothetical protein